MADASDAAAASMSVAAAMPVVVSTRSWL